MSVSDQHVKQADDRLSALDATFLELEQADEGALMHIGSVLLFEPPPNGRAPSIDGVRSQINRRLEALPRYRQRLSEPRIGGLAWPTWLLDERFDIDAHIRHETLPSPGAERELLDWASDFFSHRLDRLRPLWEVVLLDRLQDGRWALACKTHHCLVDGVGSVDVVDLLLDKQPLGGHHATARQDESLAGDGGPDRDDRARAGRRVPAVEQAMQAWAGAAKDGAHALLHPRDVLKRSVAAVELLAQEELHPAPHTSLGVQIGAMRSIESVRFPLEEIKAIRAKLGGTVNDVLLSATTTGLRELLLARAESLPAQGLRAMVPVNLRNPAEHDQLGNRVSSMFVDLPVAEDDLLRRYAQICAATARAKASGQASGANALLRLSELAPPVLHATVARSAYATRLFNVTITNVPASPQRLYAFGAPMVGVIPIVPLAANHAVGVAIVSYAGDVTFGLCADRASVPDLDVLAGGVFAALLELDAVAHEAAEA